MIQWIRDIFARKKEEPKIQYKKYRVKYIIDGDLFKEYYQDYIALNKDNARYNFWDEHNEYYHDILDVIELKDNK